MNPLPDKTTEKSLFNDSSDEVIRVRGARQHNLKNIGLEIALNYEN